MSLSNLRTATPKDIHAICASLSAGEKSVLVRSLLRPDQFPYPLADICTGPFYVDKEGLWGNSLKGIVQTLRVQEEPPHYVLLRDEGKDWYGPEMGSVILLVPKIFGA